MCRIAGIISKQPEREPLELMAREWNQLLQHGGPDSSGTSRLNGCNGIFFHRRLSIIDLTVAGHQPMPYLDDRYQITYNGEIYNYRELREELQLLGYRFESNSDTEVILAAHHCWGTAAYARFKGMFAFALYDQEDKSLVLARDPAGIKPLYYSLHRGDFMFASEVRAFRVSANLREENADWPFYFLAYGHLPEPVTTLRHVKPVSKGCFVRYHTVKDTLEEGMFERLSFLEKINHHAEAVEQVQYQLTTAVQRHLVADAVPGVFLSGGLDSAIIALLAARQQQQLNTLSLYFREQKYSEKQYQDSLSAQLGSIHHSYLLTASEFHDNLPAAIHAMDLPCCDGINTWFISRLARQSGIKAVLSGIGGDELLGGYPSFSRIRLANLLTSLPQQWLRRADTLTGKYRRLCYLSINAPAGKYLFLRGQFIPAEIARQLNADELEVWQKLELLPATPDISHLSPGNQASWLETNLYMQNQLIRDADVMGMAHGIEIRVPFLDKEFLRTVMKIQSDIKFKKKVGKYLLVEAFRNQIPEQVWNRPKMGFTFPFREWLSDARYATSAGKPAHHRQLSNGQLHFSQFITLMQLQNYGRI